MVTFLQQIFHGSIHIITNVVTGNSRLVDKSTLCVYQHRRDFGCWRRFRVAQRCVIAIGPVPSAHLFVVLSGPGR